MVSSKATLTVLKRLGVPGTIMTAAVRAVIGLRLAAFDVSELCAPGWIRTNGLRIRSPPLYPLSYGRACAEGTGKGRL
jgi:hypothetical protein